MQASHSLAGQTNQLSQLILRQITGSQAIIEGFGKWYKSLGGLQK